MQSSQAYLLVRGLSVKRGKRLLFQGIDCQLSAGDCVWLRGANGSGKSSFLLALVGLQAVEAGTIDWYGKRLWLSDEMLSKYWYFVSHKNALKENLTLRDNLRLSLGLYIKNLSSIDIQTALNDWGLSNLLYQKVATLSQGQKRKVALLKLMLSPWRDVWLLDEPFDSLDKESQNFLAECINEHREKGGAILFTSHHTPPEMLAITRQHELLQEQT